MNIQRTTTSAALVLMALSVVFAAFPGAYAQQTQGMSLTATAEEGSDAIMVSGKTTSTLNDVTLTVMTPNLKRVHVAQYTPDANGQFEELIKISPSWTENGLYEVKVKQADNSLYTLQILVEINDGVATKTAVTASNLPGGILTTGPNVAEDAGLTMEVVGEIGTNMVTVTGTTDRLSEDITLVLTAPNGNHVTTDQISPNSDGTYSTVIITGGDLWGQDGFYTVTAQQNENPLYQASDEVDIKDGLVIPEFGAIAALVLAVAIVSIIAVSARSRLSIVPRY